MNFISKVFVSLPSSQVELAYTDVASGLRTAASHTAKIARSKKAPSTASRPRSELVVATAARYATAGGMLATVRITFLVTVSMSPATP